MTDRFVDPAVAGERFDRLRVVIERSALAANRGADRAHRGGPRRGPEQEGPGRRSPPARRQHRLVHFTPPTPLRAGAYATVEITGAAPHHLTGRFVERRGRAGAPRAHPRRRPLTVPAPVVVLGPTASGKSDVAMAAAPAVAGTEIVAVDAMQVYRGMDIGTAKPTRGRPGGGPPPRPRPRRPGRRVHGQPTTAPAYDATPSPTIDRPAAARRRHRALPDRGARPPRPARAVAGRPGRARGRARRRRAAPAARRARPGRRRAHRAGQPAPHRAGPRGRRSAAAARSARSAPASRRTRRPTATLIGLRWPRAVLAERIERRVAGDDGRRPARRGRARCAAGGMSRTARQALGYKELLDHLDGAVHARRGRRHDRRCAPASSPSARSGGSVATLAYAGSTSTATRSPRWSRPWSTHCTHDAAHASPSTTDSATTSSSRSIPAIDDLAGARPPACATAARGVGADGLLVGERRRRIRRPDGAVQRRRQPGRDERQRHPLLRPGARRAARRPRRRRRSSPTPARARSSCRPTEDPRTIAGHASTWARSAELAEPDGWAALGAHPDRPVAHLGLGNPHTRRRRRRRRAPSTCWRSAGRSRTSTWRSSSPVPSPNAITMRVHERGAGITEACGTGAAAAAWAAARWGLVDAGVTRTRRAHGRRQRESGARTGPNPAASPSPARPPTSPRSRYRDS